MQPTRRPRIKVCCIQDEAEAWAAIGEGADALGLVSTMPSGPGVIAEETIARVAEAVPPPVATFLLTCARDVDAVAAQHRRVRTTAVQLCDRLERGTLRDLRAALPGVRIVQVVHVTGPEAIEEAVAATEDADALLLDSGDRSGAVPRLGGTGRRHDWALSRRIREAVSVPVFLAGGLTAENVAQAIDEVGPFALDVCTGVRIDGRLDESKLVRFVSAAYAAGSATAGSDAAER
jgi:phosphoribosylanthranilate isomerase